MVDRILIVDDEVDIYESVGMLVEAMGYEAATVNSGAKALDILGKEKFDLVLLDILMPKMSGIETLKKIRADPKLKDQDMVFLSVVSPSRNGRGVIGKLNPLDYIEKPIDNVDFKKKIKKILG
jgi:CheY-like chemotaxis protein